MSAPAEFTGNSSKPIYYNNKIIFQGWTGNYYFDIYDPQSSTWSLGQFPQNIFIESVILVNNAFMQLVATMDYPTKYGSYSIEKYK